MKRVAFLYDHVLDAGGVENHLLGLARCLKEENLRFSVLGQTSPAFRSRAAELGLEVIPQPARRSPLSPAWAAALVRQIRSEKMDLLHIHGAIAATPGRVAAALAGIPAVTTFHNPASRYHGTRQTLRARAGRSLYVAVDRWLNIFCPGPLIYVSRTFMEEEIAAGRAPRGKAAYIPNGVNLAAFAGPPPERPASPLVILFAGRLAPEKGCDVLLGALALLPPDLPPFECWIAGDGPERPALEDLARGFSPAAAVRFLGFRADVPQLMARADLFVQPSRSEAASIALLEALASGLPAVVTPVGDAPFLVSAENGCLVPVDDPPALARELSRLLRDEPLRRAMSACARRRALDFDERQTARQVLQVYRRLLG